MNMYLRIFDYPVEMHARSFNKEFKGLILTGDNYPGHKWKETTPLIHEALEMNEQIHMDVSYNINDLFQYDLRDYDFL